MIMRYLVLASFYICIIVGRAELKVLNCKYIGNWECEHYRNCRVSNENLKFGTRDLQFTGSPDEKNSVENLWFDNSEVELIPSEVFTEFPNLRGIIITNKESAEGNPLNITKRRQMSSNLFRELGAIKTLTYRDDFIVSIEQNAFDSLRDLESFKFSAYSIESFPSNLLRNSRKLSAIYLHLKKFDEFNEFWFVSFPSLESLTIFSSKIEWIPKTLFSRNRRLRYINFNSNEINIIDQATFNELTNLEHLELSFNQLNGLPANLFSRNKNLHTINLQFNHLRDIHPNLFAGLDKLTKIYLGHNKLVTLPGNVFLTNFKLTDITLDYNVIEYLPVEIFDTLNDLEIVYLERNDCPRENYIGARRLVQLKSDLDRCYRNCISDHDCSLRNNI